MNILAIGDIVGERTVAYLSERLWHYRRENNIDMVIANGENADKISGIDAQTAKELLSSGVDVITGGNHTSASAISTPFLKAIKTSCDRQIFLLWCPEADIPSPMRQAIAYW